MRGKFLLTGLLAFVVIQLDAQKDEKAYRQRSQEVQAEIWNNAPQAFSVKTIPAEMNNESAVIIATSFNVINSSKARLKFAALTTVQRMFYQTTFHERVKINDKAALDDYSTLEYQKKLDKTVSALFIKVYNKMDTYVGAKIIKPNGKEVMVNTDEEVLTKDDTRRQDGKIAIPDLQVGDILDYYLCTEKLQEYVTEVQGPYTFFLGGDYPILYQGIRLQLDEKSGVEYVSANGAPALKESRDDDNNIILSIEEKNLPKLQTSVFASPYRQYPYISLQYMFVTKKDDASTHFNRGEVKHGSLSDDLLTQFKTILQNPSMSIDYSPYDITATYFGGERAMKAVPQDSVIKVLYKAWRYQIFCSFSTHDIDMSNDINYATANSLYGAISMSRMLRKIGIDHDIVLLCPRTSNKLKDVMEIGDFSALIHVKLKKEYWLAFYDVVTQFNEIPVWFQGEQGLVFKPDVDAKHLSYEQSGTIKVPVDGPEKNTRTENINVGFDATGMQQLKIDRSTELTGYMRHYTQKELMLMEDMEADLATAVNEKKLTERLADDKKQKKLVDEFTAAFAHERTRSKSYFEDEIKDRYDQEAKQLASYEVEKNGMFNAEFAYHTTFTMDNFVKRAGNNYILEAGKLIGSFNKLDEKDRTRTIDVYTPCAQICTYNVTVSIPHGYKVKGLENFSKTLNNETGSLTASAIADDTAVHITIKQSFASNFEPAANWPKLVELMDGLYDLSSQKLLLEKSN
ncbi:MAG TPA: hypothetical protein VEV83_11595 [Parafilimonas sp.]|nr:hypothetical protein [Parafilimonas sp.]